MTEIQGKPEISDRFTARLHVAVFVEAELLRLGLQAMLPGLESVAKAELFDDRALLEAALADGGFHVLIVSSANPSLRSMQLPVLRRGGVRTLMVLDPVHAESDTALTRLPADGYLLREDLTAGALDRALAQLAADEMPMPLSLGRQLLSYAGESAHSLPPRVVKLTSREHDVLVQLVAGLSNKQIARHLRISEHGVKRLVSSVLLKLGAANRTAAVVTAIKLGLID